jgi:hypothetical protein
MPKILDFYWGIVVVLSEAPDEFESPKYHINVRGQWCCASHEIHEREVEQLEYKFLESYPLL